MRWLLFALVAFIAQFAFASEFASPKIYKSVADVSPKIKVPTVVDVPVSFFDRNDCLVVKENGEYVPCVGINKGKEIPISVYDEKNVLRGEMSDSNFVSYFDFAVDGVNTARTLITIKTPTPVSASSITFLFDNNVSIPALVKASAIVNGQEKVLISETKMNSASINFPNTFSNEWKVVLTHIQPLRISEVKLNSPIVSEYSVRFLAIPDGVYKVFINPDSYRAHEYKESGDLFGERGLLKMPKPVFSENPLFVPADSDDDGVADTLDNCVSIKNADQIDEDSNGRGDACDDFDRDGKINSKDNCVLIPNFAQLDEDEDGIGNECDNEESRFTEANKWVPWAGIGLVSLVILVLVAFTARKSFLKENIS